MARTIATGSIADPSLRLTSAVAHSTVWMVGERRPPDGDGWYRRFPMLSRTKVRRAAVVVGVVSLVAIWWWPGLSGFGGETRVAIALGGEARVARESLERRLREEGLRTIWLGEPESWCDLDDLVDVIPGSVEVVVISAPETSDCRVDLDGLGAGRRVVALESSIVRAAASDGELAESLRRQGVRMVDADRLLARAGQPADCLWWDDCPSSGSVVVVDARGLNAVGGERVARLLVAAVIE